MRGWKHVTDFLALRRNTSLLLAALVLALTGEKLWLGFAPKYLETLGSGVFIIGLFDFLQTFLGAVYAYPGGWLTDHWSQRRSLLLFNALSLTGYVLVLAWHSLACPSDRRIPVPGLERTFVTCDILRDRHLTGPAAAHHGRGSAIHGPSRSNDGWPARRWLAHHPVWLGTRRPVCVDGLHRPERSYSRFPVVHVRPCERTRMRFPLSCMARSSMALTA